MMNNDNSIGIIGLGYYLPEEILTNQKLESLINTSDEWISSRTGIKERRIASSEEATSDLAVQAASKALKSANISPEEIDLIIVATLSPDMQFPSTACIVQHKLGLKNAVAFDIEAACSGFIFAMSIAEQYLKNNTYKTALVIGAEIFSRIIDWQDRNTCVLFGDGAGAVILRKVENNYGIISINMGSDGSGADLLKIPAGGSLIPTSINSVENKLHFIKMNGKEIYKFATNSVVNSLKIELDKRKIKTSEIDLLIPHQANIKIIECIADKLSLSADKVFVNLEKYGNTSAASIPIAICEAYDNKKLCKNDLVILIGFGAGLNWGSVIYRWNLQ